MGLEFGVGGQFVIGHGIAPGMRHSRTCLDIPHGGRQDPAGTASEPAAPAKPAPAAGEAPISHVGASFVDLNARQENWLQQIVWRLEKHRGNK